ncbi:MAG: oligopeptide transporter periplasmic oligopeptide-binding protein [Panacagrimonas sp.]|jgi:oligopeptide transport system substrate-binding protein|nr:peptide ABC transporter substrate-binding protein [Panacagrimonas sp.]MCC2657098.1 oligopeptide transporter periplasmic oligopeptide-binding protein [Panacagrimonas sp.]
MKTQFRLRLVLALLAILLSGPALAGSQSILRKGNGPEVESLDPHKIEGVSAANVLRDLYEGLVAEGPDAQLRPGVAESWNVSDDLLTYTFRLRENARWSNGDPVTADDFVAGLRRSVDPSTGSHYAQMLAPIENAVAVIDGKLPPEKLGVTSPDPRTLVIRLKGPTPYLLGMLVHASTYPIHRPSMAQYGSQFAQPGKLVSNGAYRLKERVVQSHITLERNPRYWDDANTGIEIVQYLNTEDLNSEFKRFRAGELDWTYEIPAAQAPWIRANMPNEYKLHTYLGIYYYGFNLSRPPFKNNPKLRRALTLAIDRKVICEKVLGMGEQPADAWIPPGTTGHRTARAQWSGWPREQSLAEARRLYAEAGYTPDKPARVELLYNTHENHKKVATAIAAMWKQWLGVDVVLVNQEWKVYLQSRRLKSTTQVFRAGWIGDYNDASSFLEILQSGHGLNDTGYASKSYDDLLAKAASEADPVRREEWMHEAEAQLLEDLPVIPIYFYVTKRLVSPRVKGWSGNIMDHHPSRFMRLDG